MKAPVQSLARSFPEAFQKNCLHGFGLPSFHWYVHLPLLPWLSLPSSLCPVLGPYGDLTSPCLPAHYLLRCTGPFAPFPWPPMNAAAHPPRPSYSQTFLCSQDLQSRSTTFLLSLHPESSLLTSMVPLGFQGFRVLTAQLLSSTSASLSSWGPKHRLFH